MISERKTCCLLQLLTPFCSSVSKVPGQPGFLAAPVLKTLLRKFGGQFIWRLANGEAIVLVRSRRTTRAGAEEGILTAGKVRIKKEINAKEDGNLQLKEVYFV